MLFQQKTQLVWKCVDSRLAAILFPLEDTSSWSQTDSTHHNAAQLTSCGSPSRTRLQKKNHTAAHLSNQSCHFSPFFFSFLLCFIYIVFPPTGWQNSECFMAGRDSMAKDSQSTRVSQKHPRFAATVLNPWSHYNAAAMCYRLNTNFEVHMSEMSAQGLISFTWHSC